ncbi:MAG TPA: DNA-processing protein DprA [Candidatus Limiplasma sp.]|nr:DNA-processing protein DprA [Candidatus Limiplasma sp.]HRX09601.1 DNA-processing protein DprA [Candidatus Limiplasma sp.]
MVLSNEQRSLLWLSCAEITADRVQKLIAKAGSALALWDQFAQGKRFSKHSEANNILNYYQRDGVLDQHIERMERKGIQLLFADDARYPELLKSIDDPPYLLYCMGDVSVLSHLCVAVVGTRHPSGYGADMARTIASTLGAADVCVVSGMAIGIDANAHKGALTVGGKTVAVLGSGLSTPYPPDNVGLYHEILSAGGLVLSEYPPDARPHSYHFPHRNRVISGLCRGIVFVEGRVKSGGMITVRTALDQGREVFAVPGNIGQYYAEGPNTIIREGAVMIASAEDILTDLGIQSTYTDEPEESQPATNPVLRALQKEAMGMDALQLETGLTTDALMTQLCMLEISGEITRDSGNIYRLLNRL